jgi:hypothetical protein
MQLQIDRSVACMPVKAALSKKRMVHHALPFWFVVEQIFVKLGELVELH